MPPGRPLRHPPLPRAPRQAAAPVLPARLLGSRLAVRLPLLLTLLLAGTLAGAAGSAWANGQASFEAVTGAWAQRDAKAVVALMCPEHEATLRLDLLMPRVAGDFQSAQARQTLKEQYFERIRDVRFKDVTPREQRNPTGYQVRIYDYGYRVKGKDPVTTRMTITLKAAAGGGWELASINERPRPE